MKAGRVEFKLDKNGNVAVPVGKFSFAENQLVENGTAVIEAVVQGAAGDGQGSFRRRNDAERDDVARSARRSVALSQLLNAGLATLNQRLSTSSPMRPEKANIVSDLSEKLNRSPFLLVTDYQRMKVDQFGELRNRLAPTGAEVHVVKNSFLETRDDRESDCRMWPTN